VGNIDARELVSEQMREIYKWCCCVWS